MSYPIRYRLINKVTGEILKKRKLDNYSWSYGHRVGIIYPKGNAALVEVTNSYSGDKVSLLSCADYYLEVALDKDTKGNWIYKRVGH